MRQGYLHLIRHASIIAICFLLASSVHADLAEAWSYNITSAGGAAVSDSGGVYLVGQTTYPIEDAILHRLRSDGTLHWTRVWDSGDRDFVEQFAVDNRGYAYMHVRVYIEGSGNSMVVLCYDSLGTRLWEDWPDVPSLGTWDAHVDGMDVSSNGHLALSGHFYDPEVSGLCDSNRTGVFLFGYGPDGPNSRWMQTIKDDNYYIGNETVAVGPTGSMILPVSYFGPLNCQDSECEWIPGCEMGRNYEVRKYNSSGALHSFWPEPMESRVKFFDDGSYCTWQIDYNHAPSIGLKHYGSDGNLKWSTYSNRNVGSVWQDGYGNIYAVSAIAGDKAPPATKSPESDFYRITKHTPTGSVTAETTFDQYTNAYGGAVLPDGRFFTVVDVHLPDGELYVLREYNQNLYAQDDFTLATTYDHHYILGADAAGAIYLSNGSRILKMVTDKKLTIVDINGDPMSDLDFTLSTVDDDAPIFTEHKLGDFTTDSEGQLQFEIANAGGYTVELHDGTHSIDIGDRIRVGKHVHAEPARRHSGSMFNIHLDNAKFDTDGSMSYDELDGNAAQEIIMDHTEIRYNPWVTTEWRATPSYVSGMMAGMWNMANYLYDVTDGQVRFDTVTFNTGGNASVLGDIYVKASNIEWAHCENGVNGIMALTHETPRRIIMPRKFYGDSTSARNKSYTEGVGKHGVLDVNTPTDYRTRIHEFGHYAFGFFDEYLFWNDGVIGLFQGYERDDGGNLRCQPRSAMTYGFMDYQYDYGQNIALGYTTEMSSKYRYESADCRNTKQYREYGMSCWSLLETLFEGRTWGADNLDIPIIKPDFDEEDERHDLTPISTFIGPNNDLNSPDYDVGAKLVWVNHAVPTTPDYINKSIRVAGVPGVDRADVVLVNKPGDPNSRRPIYQGKSSDEGKIWVLGVYSSDYKIDVTKRSQIGRWTTTVSGSGSYNAPNSTGSWHSGSIANQSGDSAVINIQAIDGDYPILFALGSPAGTAIVDLLEAGALAVAPTIDLTTADSGMFSYSSVPYMNSYTATISHDLGYNGLLSVNAVDASAVPFSFHCPYNRVDLSSDSTSPHITVIAPSGLAEVLIDTANSTLTEATMLSSGYPVPLTGVGPEAVQVGAAYTLAFEPDLQLEGNNQILIRYYEDDLLVDDGVWAGYEAALGVYRWDVAGATWQEQTSVVDTLGNMVAAEIEQGGIYTLFTEQVVSDVDDEEHGRTLPYRFELKQNYPNPFNPATTIEYAIPERSHVKIEVLNILGQVVATLVDAEISAGLHTAYWNGEDQSGQPVATGVYLYRFETGDYTDTKKMLLIK